MKPKHNKTNNKESYSHQHDYPVEEVWNTYHTLSQIIVPRLQALRLLTNMGIVLISKIYESGTVLFKR